MRRSMIATCFAVLCTACGEDPAGVVPTNDPNDPGPLRPGMQLLTNGSAENGATGWWNAEAGPNQTVDITTAHAADGSHSLRITSEAAHRNLSHWAQTVQVEVDSPVDLELRLQMRMEEVDGDGIAFVIHGDDTRDLEDTVEVWATTEFDRTYLGSADWQTITLRLTGLTADVEWVRIFLVMGRETTGVVYFDDVTLTGVTPVAGGSG